MLFALTNADVKIIRTGSKGVSMFNRKSKGFFFKEKKTQRGFTLIELLVVISIIGILAALALVSYSGAQKQARDTERRSDLGQYRNGMEEYAATNNGVYPEYSSPTAVTTVCTDALTAFISDCTVDDPLGGTNHYSYQSDGTNTGYILYADIETSGWWFVCSSGKVGTNTQLETPEIGDCTGSTGVGPT